jgi:RNA polymerase sigma-70 factor, ECF subfamily
MPTIASLVEAAQRGDREAFAKLVRRFQRVTVATALAVTRDFHLAEDIAQDAFLTAHRRLADVRRPDSFGSWLLQLTRRVALKRTPTPKVAVLIGAEAFGTAQAASETAPADEELIVAIGRLPEQERIVVVLHYLDGRPVAEVAEMLARPVGTVTKQLSRAMTRLKQLLKDRP